LEIFQTYEADQVFESYPLKSVPRQEMIQKFLVFSHDIIQVTALNLGYFLCIYSFHRIYLQISLISEYLMMQEEFGAFTLKRGEESNLFNEEFRVICEVLGVLEINVDKCVGWFLLIVFPTSILILVLQLYKALVGFDTDLYYTPWESGCDVVVYLFRIWILVTSGYIIHTHVKKNKSI
jgi:hypothetical protein